MKIFKVWRDEDVGWDEYREFVVVARNEEEAANYEPDGKVTIWSSSHLWHNEYPRSWASSRDVVKVQCVGIAAEGLESGHIVCTDFNAS